MSESKKYCLNCKRDIAEMNFVTHTVHCSRYIQICSQCNEPVPKKEMDDHMKEFHAEISCEKCGDDMQVWERESHEKNCVKRLEACQYCELSVAMNDLNDHESHCGARTEVCSKCKKYVMIKDIENHKYTCIKDSKWKTSSSQISVEEEIKCDSCDLLFKASVYVKHEKLCCGRFQEYRQNKNSSTSSSSENESPVIDSSFSTPKLKNDLYHNFKSESDTSSSLYGILKGKNCSRQDDAKEKYHLCTGCTKSLVTDPNKLCSDCLKRQNIGGLSTDDNSSTNKSDVSKEEKMVQCSQCDDYFSPETGEPDTFCKTCLHTHTAVGNNYVLKKPILKKYEFGRGKSPILQDTNVISTGSRKRELEENRQLNNIHESHSWKEKATVDKQQKKNWADLLAAFRGNKQHSIEVESFYPMCLTCKKRFHMQEIDDHMKACGIQETVCPICNKVFMMKDIEFHVNICADIIEKRDKAVQNRDPELPNQKFLSKGQKKKLSKQRKKDARNEANDYLATSGKSYSDIAKGTKVEVIDEIPCEFCNKCFPSAMLIFHQSGCRPDLLHFPKQDCDKDKESDEDGYAKAPRSVRPKINNQKNEEKLSKYRDDINKEAVHQNYSNRTREFNLPKEEQSTNHYSKNKFQQSGRNFESFSSTEESKSHLSEITDQSVSKSSGSALKYNDSTGIALKEEFSHLMRGRGRARPTHTAPLPRPGEFLQRSQNVKLSQTKVMSLAELSQDLNKVTLNQADSASTSSMLPYVYEHRDDVCPKKLKSTPSSESNRGRHSYEFKVPSEGSTVEELIDRAPWKKEYSKNLLNKKDECDEASSAKSNVNKMNIPFNDVSDDACKETNSDVSSDKCKQDGRNADCSSVDRNAPRDSYRFTAFNPSVIKLFQQPYISRNARLLSQQNSKKAKIERGNNENDDENVIDNPDNSKGSLLILTIARILFLVACLSMSFGFLLVLLLLYCIHNHYDIFILLIAHIS